MAIFIGAIIGSILGLTGAGGSVFAVPLIMLILGLSASDSMGIALGAVSVAALLGAIGQRKQVQWVPALALAISGALTAPLGKLLATSLHEDILVTGFVVIATVIAIRMFYLAITQPQTTQHLRASIQSEALAKDSLTCRLSPTGKFQLKPKCIGGLAIGGTTVGIASGLFGVGGGFLIIPLLLYLSALPMPSAIATSLAVIACVSSSGFIAHVSLSGLSDISTTGSILIGAIVAMLLCQRLSHKINGAALQILFATMLALVSSALLINQFHRLALP